MIPRILTQHCRSLLNRQLNTWIWAKKQWANGIGLILVEKFNWQKQYVETFSTEIYIGGGGWVEHPCYVRRLLLALGGSIWYNKNLKFYLLLVSLEMPNENWPLSMSKLNHFKFKSSSFYPKIIEHSLKIRDTIDNTQTSRVGTSFLCLKVHSMNRQSSVRALI